MIFHDHGQSYNTQDMFAFRTGDVKVPFIFMTQDHAQVFFFLKDPDGVIHPAKATEADIREAAEMFGLAELLAGHRAEESEVQLQG